jgi:hypothetical protein
MKMKSHLNHENACQLAWAVLALARDARSVLSGLATTDRELNHLLQRIDALRASVSGRPQTPVARWLENLRREVEAVREPACSV